MMDIMLIVLILAVMLALCLLTESSPGRSQGMMRSHAMIGGSIAIGILFIPNRWLQGLAWIMLVNWLRDRDPGQHISRVYPFFLLLLLTVILLQKAEAPLVWWGLLVMVAGGSVVGFWSLISWLRWPNDWMLRWGPLWLYETYPANATISAGQENPNNLQSVCVISACAACGLAWGWSKWWLLGAVLPLSGILVSQWTANLTWVCEAWGNVMPGRAKRVHGGGWYQYHRMTHPTLGPILLLAVAIGVTPLLVGWWSMLLFAPVGMVLVWGAGEAMRHEVWWDSYRVKTWVAMLLTGWWNGGWLIRLMGRGWGSWLPFFDFMQQVVVRIGEDLKRRGQPVVQTQFNLSTAHSEYVQILFEHGLFAFIFFAGYITTSLWRLAHGSVEAQAVYIAALSLCGVATVLHPGVWYHNTGVPAGADGKPVMPGEKPVGMLLFSIGCPALNWMTFLVILMVEVVR